FDGRERVRHLRQEALVARVDDDADRELVDHGRSECLLRGKTLAHRSISCRCTGDGPASASARGCLVNAPRGTCQYASGLSGVSAHQLTAVLRVEIVVERIDESPM